MALAKGSKALLLMLGLAYVVFLAVFFYKSFTERELKTVPPFETKMVQVPTEKDEATLQEFARNYYEVEVVLEDGTAGRYKLRELRPRDVEQKIADGQKEFLGADSAQAAAAENFVKQGRLVTAAQVKAGDGKIVVNKGVELGLMQIELLTKYGVAGKEKIPLQGHGQIIGINATMGFVILNFLILVALLYGLLWEPIKNMLDERAASIRKDIEQATAGREDAEKLKVRYEQALANARSEANRMRQEKIREADEEKERIITRAREEARRLADDAQAHIEAATAEAKRELRKELGGISAAIAAQILAKEVDQNVHRQLIDDFLRNLETQEV